METCTVFDFEKKVRISQVCALLDQPAVAGGIHVGGDDIAIDEVAGSNGAAVNGCKNLVKHGLGEVGEVAIGKWCEHCIAPLVLCSRAVRFSMAARKYEDFLTNRGVEYCQLVLKSKG